ncbi:MAG: shikimate dehydrogenase [Bacteroidia bacterium]|nr:shikimate dehydrogenase [Bacteroidia bacterium]
MRRFGLIGYPLGHSFSPAYFAAKFSREGIQDAVYEAFPLEQISDFPALLQQYPDIAGLNVTIPWKEAVIPYLDELSAEAREAGAVNTIAFEYRDGKRILTGYNTDIAGFSQTLAPHIDSYHHTALIFGTGGAAKAVAYVLRKMGIDHYFISRGEEDRPNRILPYSYLKPEHIRSIKLLINTTPLGQYPDVDNCVPIAYEMLDHMHVLYDLVYNPEMTLFLQKGQEAGATVINGSAMLKAQAEAAWKIWNRHE